MTLGKIQLFRDWHRAVAEGNPNDFLICVTASSRTSMSGSGKSTLQTFLAKACDKAGGFDATKKASLDARDIAYEFPKSVPSRSSVVWDEAQGAPGTIGLDARRAMKTEAIEAMQSILANRDKMWTIIIGAQHLPMLDTRVYGMIDAWVMITKGPDEPDGPQATYHKIYTEDYNLKGAGIKTPIVETFSWPKIPHDDDDYRELEKMKQKAKQKRNDDDEDKELPKDEQMNLAQEYRNIGRSVRWIADNVDAVTYSAATIHRETIQNSGTSVKAE